MYNTSASELEGVASDLSQIARTYTSAAHTLDQQVITLEGAVTHVLNDGVMQWKGLSSEAFVSAWLERRARLTQASTLMSTSATDMTTLVQAIESNLSIIRAGQSIQTQAIFASMASNDQQAVLDEVSQAQNAIFMALNALNSQLEALAAEVGNCPEVDREASTPGMYDNVNRNDAGGGVVPADEGGKGGDEPVDASPPLVNEDKAQIDPNKFEKYSMDPDNPNNRTKKDDPQTGKWVDFQKLGYDVMTPEGRAAGAQDVMNQVREELPNQPAVFDKTTPFGPRYEVDIPITGPNGKTGKLVTIWQYDAGSTEPRLVTNWLKS
jgi:hypothetical protein